MVLTIQINWSLEYPYTTIVAGPAALVFTEFTILNPNYIAKLYHVSVCVPCTITSVSNEFNLQDRYFKLQFVENESHYLFPK